MNHGDRIFRKTKQNLVEIFRNRAKFTTIEKTSKFFQKFKVQNPNLLLKSPLLLYTTYTAQTGILNVSCSLTTWTTLGEKGFADCPHMGGVKNNLKSVNVVYERPHIVHVTIGKTLFYPLNLSFDSIN